MAFSPQIAPLERFACGRLEVFDYPDYPDIGVLAGSFDQPDRVPPVVQYGIESRVHWWHGIEDLPGDQPTYADDPKGMFPRIQASNWQHPDHDT